MTRPDEHTARAATVMVMCFGAMMTFLQITSPAAALAAIQDDLRVGPADLVWVPSGYTLPVAALILGASTLGDLAGRKRIFGAGVVIMVIGSLVAALADSLGVLIAGQLVSGLGGALILPNSLAILGATFPEPHRRAEMVTAWAAASGVGLAVGPVLAGALLEHFSWHVVFLPTVVLGGVTLLTNALWVTGSRQPGARLDLPGLVLASVALAAFVYGVIEGGSAGYAAPRILGTWGVAALALVAFIAVERRRDRPMLDLSMFRSRSFSTVMLVAAVSLFGFTGVAITQALYLLRVQRLSALQMGTRLLVLFVAYVVVAALTGRLLRRTGFKAPLAVGAVVGALAAVGLTTQGPGTAFTHVWPYFALFGAACGMVAAPSTAAALVSVPPDRVAAASGAVNTARQLGSVLGSAVLGAVLAHRLTTALPGELAERGVPPQTGRAVEAAVAAGRTAGQTLPAPVRAAVADAFTAGVNLAMLLTAAVLLATAVLVVAFVANRPRPEAAGAADGPRHTFPTEQGAAGPR